MPTYQYECENCGPFSGVFPLADYDRAQSCPDCGEEAPRLLTLAAIGGNTQPQATGPAMPRAHAGGCACCAPRRLTAESV